MERTPGTILIGREAIAARVAEIGASLTRELTEEGGGGTGEREIVLVPIMTGAMVFTADLIRHMPLKMSIRALTASSYPGTATESVGVSIRGDVPTDLAGRHVVVIDDILDSGRTLGLIKRMISAQRPACLKIVVLLRKRKPGGRSEEVEVDHAGFDIGDEFVVGYGLDHDGFFRNLPDICAARGREP